MKRSPRAIPHLLRQWQPIEARIRAKRCVLVFLDFDGTLAAIASRPDRVHVKPVIRRALRALSTHKRASITIVSGRRRAELKRYVGLPSLNYLGLYGWERSGNERISAAARAALLKAQALLLRELAMYPGVWIEPKHHSLSIHLLNARPGSRHAARSSVRTLLKPFRGTLQI